MPGCRLIAATDPSRIQAARALFEEYAASLNISLCFQNFAQELAGLPGRYAPPEGRLWLAEWETSLAGCLALGPLAPGIGELKRLYVRPEFRRFGIGRRLVENAIREAATIGYQALRLDTMRAMAAARALYAALGFREIPPYYENPLAEVAYYELKLR